MTHPTDRNLLVGVLALQMDFVTREQLLAAMNAWIIRKAEPLEQILLENKALSADTMALLQALVAKHLELHGNDPEKSLAAVSSVGSLPAALKQLGDPQVDASLATVATNPPIPAPATTAAFLGGAPSGTGQRFRVLRPHAKGGLGEVFVAEDSELHREVALKEIQLKYADQPSNRARFVMEAEITGRLEHPGIVPVYGLGQYADGRPFYAMRFVRGDSLRDAIERFHRAEVLDRDPGERTLELRKLLGRFIDVCEAMEYAHSRGVLHRDLKPGNIMLGRYGETLVVDWGLAKATGRKEAEAVHYDEATLQPSSGSGSDHTRMGTAVGTPSYMSPEQASGRLDQLGPASDVYGLGATLYHLLVGEAPFADSEHGDILQRVQRGEFMPPHQRNPRTPAALGAICRKAMALKQGDRYPTPLAMAADIERWLADEPVGAYPDGALARTARWTRKHRAWAMSGASALALVTCIATVSSIWIHDQNRIISRQEKQATQAALRNAALAAEKSNLATKEQEARAESDRNSALAIEAKARAQRQAQAAVETAYATSVGLAFQAWDDGQVYRSRELLARQPPELRGFEWYLLWKLCNNQQLVINGHTKDVTCVRYSPDGATLFIGGADGSLDEWDVRTGQKRRTIWAQASPVVCIAVSPDGETLAAGDESGVVKLWNIRSGDELALLGPHDRLHRALAFSPDGKTLACGDISADHAGKLRFWDVATRTLTATWENWESWDRVTGKLRGVGAIAFHPSGTRIATAGRTNGIGNIWDYPSGKPVGAPFQHGGFIGAIAFSPDGRTIASCSLDRTIQVVDAETGAIHHVLPSPYVLQDVAFSPDGNCIAASSYEGVLIWNLRTWQVHGMPHAGNVRSIAFDPSGSALATTGADGSVRVWDLRGHWGGVPCGRWHTTSIGFALEPSAVLVGQWNGELFETELSTLAQEPARPGRMLLKGPDTGGSVMGTAYALNGKRHVAAVTEKALLLADRDGQNVRTVSKPHGTTVRAATFSPDDARLATASADGTVKVWDTSLGTELLKLNIHSSALAFLPDSRVLAIGMDIGKTESAIRLVDLSDPNQSTPNELRGLAASLTAIACSRTGKLLAGASRDGRICIWDLETREPRWERLGHSGVVSCLAFAPNGQTLASGSYDTTIKLWHVNSGHELATLRGHAETVFCLAFSDDGNALASGSGERMSTWGGRAKLWVAADPATVTAAGDSERDE